MRLPYFTSIYEIFVERERTRKARIFIIIFTLLACYCYIVYLVLTMPTMETAPVHVSAPSAMPSSVSSNHVTSGAPTMRPSPSLSLFRHSVSVSVPSAYTGYQTSSGGYSMTIHTTSSTSPVVIDGGGSGGGGGSNAGSSHRAENIRTSYSVSVPSLAYISGMATTSSLVESSQQRLRKHNLNADNTIASMQRVIERNNPNLSPARAKQDNWDDYGQDEEPFKDPIGDVPWVIMLVLTMTFCVRVRLKKQ